MATLSVGGTTVFDGSALQSGVTGDISGVTTFPTGMVIQSKMVRTTTKALLSFQAPIEVLSGLRLTITPKFANSMLKMSWIVNGEGQNPNSYIWRVGQDGTTAVATVGYESWSDGDGSGGPQLWSGIAVGSGGAAGDNYDSTPFTEGPFLFYVPAVNTSSRYYTLLLGTGSTSTYVFSVGRCAGGTGSNDSENAPCFGFIEEIAGPYGDINL